MTHNSNNRADKGNVKVSHMMKTYKKREEEEEEKNSSEPGCKMGFKE